MNIASRLHLFKPTILLTLSLTLFACGQPVETESNLVSEFKPTATIQEVMNSIIDPNIDYVWNSVATITTAAGTEERSPKTDEEWLAVRQHALTVLEASNLLLIEGRKVAAEGASTSSHAVELSPADIQKGIASKRQDFVAHAHALHDATAQAIAAIDAKNAEELERVGGVIDQVCEACHVQFWYPNDVRPTTVSDAKTTRNPDNQ